MLSRDALPADGPELVKLIAESFKDLETRTGFAEDLADPLLSELAMPEWIQNGVCVVDTATNQIVGCNFVSVQEVNSPLIRSIGPVAVKPGFQGRGIGKKVMELAIAKARAQDATSLRLTVDTHNPVSFSLYSRLGFEIRDVLSVVAPTAMPSKLVDLSGLGSGLIVRPMRDDDLDRVSGFVRRFCGFDRTKEIKHNLKTGQNLSLGRTSVPFVAISREGDQEKIEGFISGVAIAAFSAAENEDVWKFLFGTALNYASGHDENSAIVWDPSDSRRTAPPSTDHSLSMTMINTTRHPKLFKWLLVECGLTLLKGMYAMELGTTMPHEPKLGVWMQSVEY